MIVWPQGTRESRPKAWRALLCAIAISILLWGCRKSAEDAAPAPLPNEVLVEAEPEPTGFVQSIPETVVKSLLLGYTFEQCKEILGREADETEKDYDPGTGDYGRPSLTLWHIWRFDDGSALRLGFQSEQLRDKTFVPPGAEEDATGDEDVSF